VAVGKISLESAAVEARRAIHQNDVERLRQLIAEYPALLSWRDEHGHVLLHATTAYATDVSDPERERMYFRPQCAELLIDGGARVEPWLWERVIDAGASGMLCLLQRKGVLPRTLPVLAALGDVEVVRSANADEPPTTVNQAFMNACRFKRKAVAALLLDRSIALDADLGRHVAQWQGRDAFVDFTCEYYREVPPTTPWRTFVMRQLLHAMDGNDLPEFARWLQSQPWLLEEGGLHLQVELIEQAVLSNEEMFLTALLDSNPAVLRSRIPPKSEAIAFAYERGNAHLIPQLTRIWPLPDDLPHAAGAGDFNRVKRWFDATGKPALGNPYEHHLPDLTLRADPPAQQVLDTALAWACLNHRFEIAEFLLGHGASIDSTWSTHEPASILHECAVQRNHQAAKFLVDHGIDLTIRDYRWNGTAQSWALYAANDAELANFLGAAQARREQGAH